MHNLAEEILAPVRERSAAANAPLLAKLGVTRGELERLLRPVPLSYVDESFGRAAAKAALRGATRF